jgi:hypothetical protein
MIWKIKVAVRTLFSKLFGKRTSLINDDLFNKILYFITYGEKPDFNNPRTFNEYICSIKHNDSEIDKWIYTDKFEVRNYVKKTIGDTYLNSIFGVYDSFSDIDFSLLPNKFALKATHGSSYNIIVENKENLNIRKAHKQFDKWLSKNYYYEGREKNYYMIKPRIICDAYLSSKSGTLDEVKLFCFNGKVGFIQYNREINRVRYANIFDSKWNKLDVRYGYSPYKEDKKIDNKEEITRIAEKLAEPFKFVRVDLYNVDGKVIFSELTFHPGGGLNPFHPNKYDFMFGRLLVEDEYK